MIRNKTLREIAAKFTLVYPEYWKIKREFYEIRNYYQKPQVERHKLTLKRLNFILKYVYENSLGYREFWGDNKFVYNKLRSIEELNKIPIISKEIIYSNLNRFSIQSGEKEIIKDSTGGSTGDAFFFYRKKSHLNYEWGHMLWYWKQYNPEITKYTKRITLRGSQLNSFSLWDPIYGLWLSTFNLSANNVYDYYKLITNSKLRIIHAYPSSLYFLLKLLRDKGLSLKDNIDYVFLGSEPLYEYQEKLIRDELTDQICLWYGQSEMVALAIKNFEKNIYEFDQHYSICEVNEGEIIGTNLINRVTPFIRYKTNDFVENYKTEMGILTYSNRLVGRIQEYLITKDKKAISMVAMNMHDNTYEGIIKFKFIQKKEGEALLEYVRATNGKLDLNNTINQLQAKLGKDFIIIPVEKETITPSKRGKSNHVIQHLDIKEYL
jgi:phenylacetate-CoA ligase